MLEKAPKKTNSGRKIVCDGSHVPHNHKSVAVKFYCLSILCSRVDSFHPHAQLCNTDSFHPHAQRCNTGCICCPQQEEMKSHMIDVMTSEDKFIAQRLLLKSSEDFIEVLVVFLG